MGYNKKKHLQDNILAIETAFQLEQLGAIATAEQLQTLKQYTGFGGLKCILRPCQQAEDIEKWPLSEQELFTDTAHLYCIIKNHSASEEEYKSYVASLHTSILSAFYTPKEITEAIISGFYTDAGEKRICLYVERSMSKEVEAILLAETRRILRIDKELSPQDMLPFINQTAGAYIREIFRFREFY